MKHYHWMECPHCQGWFAEQDADKGHCPLCGKRATNVAGFVVTVVALVGGGYLFARLLGLL